MPLMTWQNLQWEELDFDRPAASEGFKSELYQRFMQSHYCNNTLLRDFMRENEHAWDTGVLNQLHRRHIVSWAFMKKFLVKIANTARPSPFRHAFVHQNPGLDESIHALLRFLHHDAEGAAEQAQALDDTDAHGVENAQKRVAFERIARLICWSANNTWIGPSHGNVGEEIDVANERDVNVRNDLMGGTPFAGIARHYPSVRVWVDG